MCKMLTALGVALMLAHVCPAAETDAASPEEVFREPPRGAHAGVWWHWMGAQVTEEGIVRDLDWFARMGIFSATVFGMADTCTPWAKRIGDVPTDGLRPFDERWWKLFAFACREGKRRGIDIGLHNCPGYTSTGGPWIPSRLAMRELVFNVTNAAEQISAKPNAMFPVFNEETKRYELPPCPARRTGYVRADRTMKETGYGELFPGMSVADLHAPACLPLDREGCRAFAPGATYEIPVDVSLVTDVYEGKMAKLSYWLRYLDGRGQLVETEARDVPLADAVLKTWQQGRLADVRVTLPEGPACGTVNITLSVDGRAIARNFQCFVTKANAPSVTPAASNWSVKEWTAMGGEKRCGAGSGFFEYAFAAPRGPAVFRAEVSTKRLNGKDAGDDHNFKSDMDLMVGGGSYDRSKNPNSYPMTSADKYAGLVRVYANGVLVKTVALPDDPADSRGILSWFAQKRAPGRGEQSQTLDEAGSYGYFVEAEIPESVLAAGRDRLVIRLEADKTGLAVYGAGAGCYPFGPHLADR